MTRPIIINLPHKLGAAEAKRRIAAGTGSLTDHIPGAADVRSSWSGDTLNLHVGAMGQEVDAKIAVEEKVVRLEVLLPPLLGFFASKIEGLIRDRGSAMLEDKSGKSG